MKNLKYISGVVSVLVVLGISYLYFGLNPASANPDYICVKSVSNPVCDISECDPWDTEIHERVCNGKKITKVGYYHTRTACQSGYSQKVSGSTASSSTAALNGKVDRSKLDGSGLNAHKSHPSSGRHSSDFAWDSISCSIVEIDREDPLGDVEQILDNGESVPVSE